VRVVTTLARRLTRAEAQSLESAIADHGRFPGLYAQRAALQEREVAGTFQRAGFQLSRHETS
jgi:hypothetical protein